MRTDSERLDWLERRGREVWKDDRVFVVVPDGNPLKCWSGSGRSLREAIDEAMEKKSGGRRKTSGERRRLRGRSSRFHRRCR